MVVFSIDSIDFRLLFDDIHHFPTKNTPQNLIFRSKTPQKPHFPTKKPHFPTENTSKTPFPDQKHLKNTISRPKNVIFPSKTPNKPHFPIKKHLKTAYFSYHFLVFRVPALALGALFCLISLKFVEDEEADNKGDKDEDKDVSVGTLMVGWVKICFNVPGQLVWVEFGESNGTVGCARGRRFEWWSNGGDWRCIGAASIFFFLFSPQLFFF
jgi:hypothetical protein